MTTIPLVDLKAQSDSIRAEIHAAMQAVIDASAFIGGEEVGRFEAEFGTYCEARGCVGVGNGTDALYLALRALGVGPGDEVITAANTFIATSEAVSLTGAHPVFVDVSNDTMLIDPDGVEKAITPRTKAIIPVHLYGQPCDMDRLLAIAGRHHLKVVEDAAQAHGARWKGRRVGTFGDAGCFSFYPGKNLGAYGDAGAVVSQDEGLIQKIRMLANHGRLDKYAHLIEGVNSRLDGLQAAILRVKLKYLEEWTAKRQALATAYTNRFRGTAVTTPSVTTGSDHVYHLYVIRVGDRDRVKAELAKLGIATGVHYPTCLPMLDAYKHLGYRESDVPIAVKCSQKILSLPMFPELTEEQLGSVVEAVVTLTGKR